MAETTCGHLRAIKSVKKAKRFECEDCVKIGSEWVHLRVCQECGGTRCCDDSPNRHATKHFHATGHAVIEGYDPPEGWGWCYVHEIFLDLSDRMTPQLGPIPRYV